MSYKEGIVSGPHIVISEMIGSYEKFWGMARESGLEDFFNENDGLVYCFEKSAIVEDAYNYISVVPNNFQERIENFATKYENFISRVVEMLRELPVEDSCQDEDGNKIDPKELIDIVWATTRYNIYKT